MKASARLAASALAIVAGFLAMVAAAAPGDAAAVHNTARWHSRVGFPYRGTADQVALVSAAHHDSTKGSLTLWHRTPRGNWYADHLRYSVNLGAHGVGATHEGAAVTPEGIYTLTQSFGRGAALTGTKIHYFRTNSESWWGEDPYRPSTYNRHVQQVNSPGGASENLYYTDVYRKAVVIDYNLARTPFRGSAFFIHDSTGRPTAGCVSMAPAEVNTLLRWLDPTQHPVIDIRVTG